jgi:nucleoside-diphosphate-sugar epimerase
MNVLVTGARGFIGRNLTAHLRAREGCVVALFDVDHSLDDLRAGLAARGNSSPRWKRAISRSFRGYPNPQPGLRDAL